MSALILSYEELRELWVQSEAAYRGVDPKDKYATTIRLVDQMFGPERGRAEIANRFYALLRCIDSSQADLDKGKLGFYEREQFHIHREAIIKLWDYFGNPFREVDPRNVVRACEIL